MPVILTPSFPRSQFSSMLRHPLEFKLVLILKALFLSGSIFARKKFGTTGQLSHRSLLSNSTAKFTSGHVSS